MYADLWLYHLYWKEKETCLLCKIDRHFTTRADLENYLIEFSIEYFKRFPEEDEMNEIYVVNAFDEKIVSCRKYDLMVGGDYDDVIP